jgi:hypothetical protein
MEGSTLRECVRVYGSGFSSYREWLSCPHCRGLLENEGGRVGKNEGVYEDAKEKVSLRGRARTATAVAAVAKRGSNARKLCRRTRGRQNNRTNGSMMMAKR